MEENYKLSHLRELEAESIHIIREVAAEFENPVMLIVLVKIRLSWYVWQRRLSIREKCLSL